MRWMILALALAGCVTSYGTPIQQASVDQIQVGQTSRQDVVGMFGPPIAVSRNHDGSEILSWAYASTGLTSRRVTQTLTVTFDQGGTVSDFTQSEVTP